MNDTEKMRFIEMENVRLLEENERLHKIIVQLNRTLNRLIRHYISPGKAA